MAPSVAHLHAWATHNSPPTSKKNRVSHSHSRVSLSSGNTDTCIHTQPLAAFSCCRAYATRELLLCCFCFHATCLNKRASRCKNTAVGEECVVRLVSESEQQPGVWAQGLAGGYGSSVLQCEQPRQINVCHVCSGKPDVFAETAEVHQDPVCSLSRGFTGARNPTQLDAHRGISGLPEMTHLPQNTEEVVGMEIVNNTYSSSSSFIFLALLRMLENTHLDCILIKARWEKESCFEHLLKTLNNKSYISK